MSTDDFAPVGPNFSRNAIYFGQSCGAAVTETSTFQVAPMPACDCVLDELPCSATRRGSA